MVKYRITADYQQHTEYEIEVGKDGEVHLVSEFDHYEEPPLYLVRGDDGDTDEVFGEGNTYEEALKVLKELEEESEHE